MTKGLIVGIAGYKSSGKDTAGSVFVEQYGFQKMSFATPIKDLVSDMFGLDRFMLEGSDCKMRTLRDDPKFGVYGKSGRELLQQIGTGLRHIVSPDIWVDMAIKQCMNDENYIFTDVRFPNEVKAIHDAGGFVIGIKRPGFYGDNHESERALDNTALPFMIDNDRDIDALKGKVNIFALGKLKLDKIEE